MQMDGLARRASVDGPRQFIKVRGDLGMPTGLRPVQLGHMAPPPLVRINHNLPIPSPPRLTFGGQPRPIGFIQQRPVGSPGNLTGVVNIIPHQARVENGGLKEVLQGVRSPPRQDSSPRPSPPGPLQSKFIDGVVPAVSRPVGRPPLSSSSSSLPAITSGVMGIKNLTPIDTGTSPKMPNLRPVQVTIFLHSSFHHWTDNERLDWNRTLITTFLNMFSYLCWYLINKTPFLNAGSNPDFSSGAHQGIQWSYE